MTWTNLNNLIKTFGRDRSGATAVIFGIVCVPLLLIMMTSIEYTNLTRERAKVQNTLDASLLAYMSDPAPNSDLKKTKYIEHFKSNLAKTAGTDITNRIQNLEITATTDYVDGKVRLNWGRQFPFLSNFQAFNVPVNSRVDGGTRTTTTRSPVPVTTTTTTYKYIDVHMVLDNSGSMNLSANPGTKPFLARQWVSWSLFGGDVYQAVPCEYACHDSAQRIDGYYDSSLNGTPSTLDYYALTRGSNGSYVNDASKLRLDIVKDAAKNFVQSVVDLNDWLQQQGSSARIRIAIYKMGPPQTPDFTDDVGKGLPRKFMLHDGLTTDKSTLTNAINSLPEQGQKLGGIQHNLFQIINAEEIGVSDARPALDEVAKTINPTGGPTGAVKGDGTATNPEKWVVVVSDGQFQWRSAGKQSLSLFTSEWNSKGESLKGNINSYKYVRYGSESDREHDHIFTTKMCEAVKDYKIMTITIAYYPNDFRKADNANTLKDYWIANCQNKGDIFVQNDTNLHSAFDNVFTTIKNGQTVTTTTETYPEVTTTTKLKTRLTK